MSGYCPPYTQDEEKAIVDYIVTKQSIHRIKGDKLWKDMEKAHVVERTWQSLKQHFRKVIIHQLNYPRYGLSADNQRLFKEHFNRDARKLKAELPSNKEDQKETRNEAKRRMLADLSSFTSSSEDDESPKNRGRNCTSPLSDTSDDDINFVQART